MWVVLGLVGVMLVPGVENRPAEAQEGSVPESDAMPLFVPLMGPSPEAFQRPPAELVDVAADPAIARARLVDTNLAVFSVASAVVLNLFDDTALVARMDRVEHREDGITWYGTIDGMDASQVIMVLSDGVLVGNVIAGERAFEIRYAGDHHSVAELDPSFVMERAEPKIAPDLPVPEGPVAEPLEDGSRIDVMIVYTPAARAEAGGTAAIINEAHLAVAETNAAYARSGITPRMNLVHVQEVAYTESGDLELDLDRLTDTTDGHMDAVHTIRNQHLADLVSLFTAEDGTATAGIAWSMKNNNTGFAAFAFSVVEVESAGRGLTFAHEAGHNQGAGHQEGSGTGGLYAYSHALLLPNGSRTLMYSHTPAIPYFSNPDVTYGGHATGNAASADNARTIDATAVTVSSFRVPDPDVFPGIAFDAPARLEVVTTGAGSEPGEPLECPRPGGGVSGLGRTVWYSYTPPGDTILHLSTADSDFDTVLAVYLGTSVDALTLKVCNDDSHGELQSDVQFLVRGGRTYYIQVGGYRWVAEPADNAVAGTMVLEAEAVVPRDVVSQMVGDFNGDGLDDVASFDERTGRWWVGRSTGTGFETSIWEDFDTGAGWATQAVGDFNGDGLDDIAGYHRDTGRWWISLSTGASFASSVWTEFTTKAGWNSQVVGDFNGDGLDDIANYHEISGRWYVARSTGSGFSLSKWTTFSTKAGWHSQIVGDFNGDGLDDIANYHEISGRWYVTTSLGGRFGLSKWTTFTTKTGWNAQVVGDFNGDGLDDIGNYHDISGRWYVADSNGIRFGLSKWTVFSTKKGWFPQVVGDFNGDGLDDIANYHEISGRWYVTKSTGGAFDLSKWSTFATKTGWIGQVVGDFNGDGRDDIANYHSSGRWWVCVSQGASFGVQLWGEYTG